MVMCVSQRLCQDIFRHNLIYLILSTYRLIDRYRFLLIDYAREYGMGNGEREAIKVTHATI